MPSILVTQYGWNPTFLKKTKTKLLIASGATWGWWFTVTGKKIVLQLASNHFEFRIAFIFTLVSTQLTVVGWEVFSFEGTTLPQCSLVPLETPKRSIFLSNDVLYACKLPFRPSPFSWGNQAQKSATSLTWNKVRAVYQPWLFFRLKEWHLMTCVTFLSWA